MTTSHDAWDLPNLLHTISIRRWLEAIVVGVMMLAFLTGSGLAPPAKVILKHKTRATANISPALSFSVPETMTPTTAPTVVTQPEETAAPVIEVVDHLDPHAKSQAGDRDPIGTVSDSFTESDRVPQNSSSKESPAPTPGPSTSPLLRLMEKAKELARARELNELGISSDPVPKLDRPAGESENENVASVSGNVSGNVSGSSFSGSNSSTGSIDSGVSKEESSSGASITSETALGSDSWGTDEIPVEPEWTHPSTESEADMKQKEEDDAKAKRGEGEKQSTAAAVANDSETQKSPLKVRATKDRDTITAESADNAGEHETDEELESSDKDVDEDEEGDEDDKEKEEELESSDGDVDEEEEEDTPWKDVDLDAMNVQGGATPKPKKQESAEADEVDPADSDLPKGKQNKSGRRRKSRRSQRRKKKKDHKRRKHRRTEKERDHSVSTDQRRIVRPRDLEGSRGDQPADPRA